VLLAAYRIAWNNWPAWPDMRDFAAFVSLSSWTTRGLGGVGKCPGGASVRRRMWVWRKGLVELGACSSVG
jgi:hypothetical protein